MSRIAGMAAIALAAVALHAPNALAQIPRQDSVTGSGFLTLGAGQGPCQFEVDARSGPSGEDPSGHTLCTPLPGEPGSRVICLEVQGNAAVMTVVRVDNGSVGSFRITDNGPGAPDVVEGNFGAGCPTPQPFLFNLGLAGGDFVVVDAPPQPTTLGDCNAEGWESYNLFRNRGGCVSFVQANPRAVD